MDQVATIERRLDQALAFFRDVLDIPALLEEIPDRSILRFSDVMIADVAVRLTAYRDSGPNWTWTAQVTGLADKVAVGGDREDASRFDAEDAWGTVLPRVGHGQTAEEALAALEETLRKATHRIENHPRPGRRTA